MNLPRSLAVGLHRRRAGGRCRHRPLQAEGEQHDPNNELAVHGRHCNPRVPGGANPRMVTLDGSPDYRSEHRNYTVINVGYARSPPKGLLFSDFGLAAEKVTLDLRQEDGRSQARTE